ncbi:hypothetical protein BX666DRAFT_1867560 [Dichotomocladium elegans]|nr:hypothetical protein BX666DRAFT_1867560 [Dichotomocladium elegans]
MPSPSDLATQNDELWRIVEKQRRMIQNLQKSLATMTEERDILLDRNQALERERMSPSPGGSAAGGPGVLTNMAAATATKSHVPDIAVATSLSPPPLGKKYNNNSSHGNITTTITAERPQQPLPLPPSSSSIDDYVKRQQQETATRRSHEELRKQEQAQMEEIMARRQQEIEEQARKIEETKHMKLMMAKKQQEVEEEARRVAEEAKRLELRKQESSTEYTYAPGPMGGITVEVLSTCNFTNDKGKQVIAFNIGVRKSTDESNPHALPDELWRIQKLYSDFLALDVNLKSLYPSTEQQLARLPDRALFSSQSSQKMEQGKKYMQDYLQQALRLPMVDMTMICEFLSSNVIDQSLSSKTSKYRQGYLTKRGKNFGGYKRRYFVLNGPDLEYYESDEGQYLGTIHLLESKVGKQKEADQQGAHKDQQPSYKHAFMIVEPKKSAPGGIARHVLCAESDAERDAWVDAISQHIDPGAAKRNNSISGTNENNPGGRKLNNNYAEEVPEDGLYAQLMQMTDNGQDGGGGAAIRKNGQSKKAFWAKKIFQSGNNAANSNGRTPYNRKEIELIGPKQVFGVPLKDAVRVAQVSAQYELPAIVYRCIEFLEAKNAIREEGIYRLSGSATKIKSVKQRFNEEGDVDLLHAEEQYDVHTISGLLKMWLRELPENVLTLEMMKDFLNVMDLVEPRERVHELGRLISMLPLANYTLLRTLSAHLIRVVQHAEVNKMTMRNVGIVFSATLAMPTGIFHLLLTEFNYIFWTDQAQQQQQRTPQHQQTTARSNRNSADYIYGAPKSIVGLERNGKHHALLCKRV